MTTLYPFQIWIEPERSPNTKIAVFGQLWDSASNEVITSIGVGTTHDTNVDITAVTENSGHYHVTLASIPADAVAGDALWDEHATPRKYRILSVGGVGVLVIDSEGVGSAPDSSATSQAEIKRYYSSITDWEADLDDTGLYASGEDAVGECYNDAVFDESVTINGGGTVGLNSVKLTVAEGERHDGTVATGVRVVRTGSGGLTLSVDGEISWVEMDFNSTQDGTMFNGSVSANTTVSNVIGHNSSTTSALQAYSGGSTSGSGTQLISLTNSVFYNLERSGHNNSIVAVSVESDNSTTRLRNVYNNTIHDITVTGTSSTATGIGVNDAGTTAKNNLVTDVVSTLSTESCFSSLGSAVVSNNASSDGTGGGDALTVSSTTEYVSTSPVDLHLAETSDCINAGTDLGADYSVDIDGNDRDGMVGNWDIGAHQYYADYDKVVTTIGAGTTHNETLSVSSIAGNGPYLITFSSSTNAVRGDAYYVDGFKYRVLEVSGSEISVEDSENLGVPPTGGNTQRYYNGSTPLTDWEADLDDTPLYYSGAAAVGECYNDATFDELFSIDNGTTIGLSSVKLTVAEGERHDGTEGTGVLVNPSTNVSNGGCVINVLRENTTLEWFEVTDWEGAFSGLFNGIGKITNGATNSVIQNNIVHDSANTSSARTYRGIAVTRDISVYNNVVYNIGDEAIYQTDAFGTTSIISNNSVYNFNEDAGSAVGITNAGSSSGKTQNNICISGGTCFSLDVDHTNSNNASSDTTGNVQSLVASDQFTSTSPVDLHPAVGADTIDAGTDLGTVANITMPITGYPNGYDRDADPDGYAATWDIGAFEFIASGGATTTIGYSSEMSWDIISFIGNIAQVNWNINEIIGRHSSTLWNTFQLIGQNPAIVWSISGLAGKTIVNEWNVYSVANNISDVLWDTLEKSGRANDINWNVNNVAGNSQTTIWNVLESIRNNQELVWEILEKTGQNSETNWNILREIGNISQIEWDVLSIVPTAGQQIELLWNIHQAIGGESEPKWDILAHTGSGQEVNWHTTQTVGKSGNALWNILSVINNTQITNWNILQNIGQTETTWWNVLETVRQENETLWNILQTTFPAGNIAVINWNVNQLASNEQEMLWNLISGLEISNIYEFTLFISLIKDFNININTEESF